MAKGSQVAGDVRPAVDEAGVVVEEETERMLAPVVATAGRYLT